MPTSYPKISSVSTPILRTPRLILRPWCVFDLKPFAELNADPKVMEFYPHPLDRKQSDALAMKYQSELVARGYGFWAVEVPGVADFIGYIGLNYWDMEMKFAPCIDIGWRLAAGFWGKGYAHEGAMAALDYGFKSLKFLEIVAMAVKENIRSCRLMQRLGMRTDPKENFEHPKLPKNHPLSWRVLYRLTSEEWFSAYERKSQKLLPCISNRGAVFNSCDN